MYGEREREREREGVNDVYPYKERVIPLLSDRTICYISHLPISLSLRGFEFMADYKRFLVRFIEIDNPFYGKIRLFDSQSFWPLAYHGFLRDLHPPLCTVPNSLFDLLQVHAIPKRRPFFK